MKSRSSVPKAEKAALSIPDRPELIEEGKKISSLFVKALRRWRAEMNEVFSQKFNEASNWPPENPADCFQHFSQRPELAKEMALEMSTVLLEIEKNKGRFGGKNIYPHQKSQIAGLIMQLLDGGNSYLIENSPGTGKTLVLCAVMHSATRLQMRGLFKGNVAYGTHRPFMLAQQAFSPEHRNLRIAGPPTRSEILNEFEYLEQFFGEDITKVSVRQAWMRCREAAAGHPQEASALVETFLEKASLGDVLKEHPDADNIRLLCTRLASGEHGLVWDTDETPMAIRVGQPVSSREESKLYYSGDLGQGIPRNYVDEGLVVSRKGAELAANQIGKETADLAKARVLLTTTQTILQHRGSILKFLENTDLVIVDEGKNSAAAFQHAIKQAKGNAGATPALVFMASALGTTNGIASRPHTDRISLRLTLEEAMGEVLPSVGVELFPGGNANIYPSGTTELLDQVMEAHFADLEIPPAVGQPQPRECTTVMIVDTESIDATVLRLRSEYQKKGMPATVVGFRANRERRLNAGNIRDPYSERVFSWMMNRDKEASEARVIVSNPRDVADAISLTNLENVTIATGKGISATTLLRLFGRLEHSNLHRGAGKSGFRGYFRQAVTRETNPKETIFHLLKHSVETKGKDSIRWVPLQTLHSAKAAKKDEKVVKKMGKIDMPLTEHGMARRTRSGHKHLKGDASLNGTVKNAEKKNVESDEGWQRLQAEARQLMLKDQQQRAHLESLILRNAFRIAPEFMRRNEDKWTEELLVCMRKAHDPLSMVENVRLRMISAARLGTVNEEHEPLAKPILSDDDEEEGGGMETAEIIDIGDDETELVVADDALPECDDEVEEDLPPELLEVIDRF